jgi:CRP-like cAMP-binding protein
VTTVAAIADGEVLAIPRKRLLDLMESQPMIGFQVYKAATKAFEHRYRMTLHRGGPGGLRGDA